jgi:mannose-6-phosphate isomerase-like protein (cupin superfamily)
MAEIHQDIAQFTAPRAWGARDLCEVAGATVRLHWTDQPYIWHTNTGAEVFMVVDGQVDMSYKTSGVEKSVRLGPNDIFVAHAGDEHIARPLGVARILVVEEKGSI